MPNNNFYAACLGISVIMAQIVALVMAWRGNERSKENGAKLDTTAAAMAVQSAKLDEIHAQTGVLTAGGKFSPGIKTE